ncbi:MAG TPA: heme ABC exporter ATP-binding protein CcmA [Ktedonobacteraceae bacterium]
MNTPLLETSGLKKSFGLKTVLRGIDLALCGGECVAMMGANGAGKTTLLRILACLTGPSSGYARVDGWDSRRDAQQVRRLVGFVAHQPYLYDELTAEENLLFFGKMYAVQDVRQRARQLLQKVGLEKRAGERVSVLSRGQVQRLSLARALLHEPRVLLLDEPDTGLDEEGHELVEAVLAEQSAAGGAVLFTTHQLERALKLADSLLMLGKGRIVLQEKTAGLELESMRQEYQEVLR